MSKIEEGIKSKESVIISRQPMFIQKHLEAVINLLSSGTCIRHGSYNRRGTIRFEKKRPIPGCMTPQITNFVQNLPTAISGL